MRRNRPRIGFARIHNEHNRYSKSICHSRNKEIILRAKSRPCVDCHVQYNPWVMDLDHRDPLQKKFVLSKQKTCSVDVLMAEIAKCDVVCANCHRERTMRGKHWAVRRGVVDVPVVISPQLEFPS